MSLTPKETTLNAIVSASTLEQAELVYNGMLNVRCPFDAGDHDLKPEDPCPICGDLGTFDDENMHKPSKCVGR